MKQNPQCTQAYPFYLMLYREKKLRYQYGILVFLDIIMLLVRLLIFYVDALSDYIIAEDGESRLK